MLELYHALTSTCSQKVRFCLAEKGLTWVDRHVDILSDSHLTPDYLALNPLGVVPTLVHDGQAVTESSVICEYIDDVFPSPCLAPSGAYQKAQMRSWMAFFSEIPTSFIRVVTLHMLTKSKQDAVSEEDYIANTERRPVRKYIFRKMGRGGFPADEIKSAFDGLRQTAERVDEQLKASEWIAGDQFSLADIVLLPSIDRLEDLGLDAVWAGLPRFGDWWSRVKSRPAYAQAYPKGSRFSHYAPDVRVRAREVYRQELTQFLQASLQGSRRAVRESIVAV
ncbi:glutathione S-transferase family protein [Novosphingobium sp. Gsoil 351]|uniref:glutathione S-transferase family protein n=1 Tax=Novosphingobium sp. Gsoil 351 TaxID=2675225 RepID=UPI0018A7ED51|nr:glutathione S-transferase family protein [Novosphingobium sp. Gsoil 351]